MKKNRISRRGFMGGSLAVLAGLGLPRGSKLFGQTSDTNTDGPKIKEYRTLGRTRFNCSDIGFGSSGVTDPAFIVAVLDAGVNYIDTAESYLRGQVESAIGKAMQGRDRKKVFISTKMGLRQNVTKQDVIDRANKCLERLKLDYVDCLQIHMPSTVAALKNEAYHSAIKDLKTEGKVRFSGLSNHGSQWGDVPETMEQVHLAAAEDGRFDVALLVYNFIQQEMGENILKAYKKKNVGATLMKTNPVMNYLEMKERVDKSEEEGRDVNPRMKALIERLKARADRAETFKSRYSLTKFNEIRDAAIKFVLNNPDVNAACPTILNYNDLEAYVSLSGSKFDLKAQNTLAAYKTTFGEFYCRHACGKCEPQCPHGVPVNTIMRYNHYFLGQGKEKAAMLDYAALPTNKADICSMCGGHCEQACPYGVPVQGLLMMAHRILTLV
ncbi:MAG: aldo/keto reductase [Candidatus Aminicenantes bacterium]|nr:MAG: aldo/keto reductase [Candidatus Aminicenantes bacterium]